MDTEPENQGYQLNEPRTGKAEESLLMRLLWLVIISMIISLAQTILTFITVLQFIIMAVSNKQPNEALADVGTTLGIWVAKAARYQTAASEVKPWPWSELD